MNVFTICTWGQSPYCDRKLSLTKDVTGLAGSSCRAIIFIRSSFAINKVNQSGKERRGLMKRNRKLAGLLLLLITLTLLPVRTFAASGPFFMLVGQQGTMSMTSNPVPNAKWKTSNAAVLKIVKQNGQSVTTKGVKFGTATLTVYNKKKTSQKYTYTVKVMKPNKLVKNDFTISGNQAKAYFGKSPYNMMNIAGLTGSKQGLTACDIRANGLTYSNTAGYLTTYRGVRIFDSYSRVCALYGKKALTKTSTKDNFYKLNTNTSKYSPAHIKNFKAYWNGQFRYYVDYKYNSRWKIRMYFNGSKELIGVTYRYNF